MASEEQDLLRLNALVDGELPAAERAELAARLAVERDLAHGYATLARLKAATGESAEEMPDIALPTVAARRRFWPRVTLAAAGLGAVLVIGLFVAHGYRAARGVDEAPNESATALALVSLPAGTTVPRLDTAGLKLVSLHLDPGHVPLFTAHYRGPHGCHLDLRAWPAGQLPLPLAGTSRYRWTVGDLVYELVAHGMPVWRFNIIAGASELQTRRNVDHDRINRRLREARSGAPPCAG